MQLLQGGNSWESGRPLVGTPYVSKIFPLFIRLQQWMEEATTIEWMTTEQDRRISAAVRQERVRLRNFIRRRVADEADAEDILQDVFYEFVQAYR
ncbi:MAG TPA: sigma factor, partial [Terriglobales bacterium]|nr:sigma factor [Terriglobales bacterium]